MVVQFCNPSAWKAGARREFQGHGATFQIPGHPELCREILCLANNGGEGRTWTDYRDLWEKQEELIKFYSKSEADFVEHSEKGEQSECGHLI